MNKDEWKRMNKDHLFDDISEKYRKNLIKMCCSIIQKSTDDEEKLEENKEKIKRFLFKSGNAQGVDLNIIQQRIALAEIVGSYLIDNRAKFMDLTTYVREEELLKDMQDIGVIEKLEEPAKSKFDMSSLYNPDLLAINKETGKKDIKYGLYSEEQIPDNTFTFEYKGKPIQLTRVGRLYYNNGLMLGIYVDEFDVKTEDSQDRVFTEGLEIIRLEDDEEYRKVFFEQVANYSKHEFLNSNGYMGDVVIGDGENKYKVDYSAETYTAVTELKSRLQQKAGDQREQKETEEQMKPEVQKQEEFYYIDYMQRDSNPDMDDDTDR